MPDFVGKLELMRVDILMPLLQDLPVSEGPDWLAYGTERDLIG